MEVKNFNRNTKPSTFTVQRSLFWFFGINLHGKDSTWNNVYTTYIFTFIIIPQAVHSFSLFILTFTSQVDFLVATYLLLLAISNESSNLKLLFVWLKRDLLTQVTNEIESMYNIAAGPLKQQLIVENQRAKTVSKAFTGLCIVLIISYIAGLVAKSVKIVQKNINESDETYMMPIEVDNTAVILLLCCCDTYVGLSACIAFVTILLLLLLLESKGALSAAQP